MIYHFLRFAALTTHYFYRFYMKYALILLSLVSAPLWCQTTTNLGVWVDHLPYQRGIDVTSANNVAYTATPQGLLIYDNSTKALQRLSVVNGLSDVGLSAIAWSDRHQLLVIGYDNGNLDLLNASGRVTNYPDLQLSSNYGGLKGINDVSIKGDTAFLATNFGIVTFDLDQRLFRETYVIGEQGNILAVEETAASDSLLYATTEQGLLYAPLSGPKFLFNVWEKDARMTMPVEEVATLGERVFVSQPLGNGLDSVFYRSTQGGPWQYWEAVGTTTLEEMSRSRQWITVCDGFSARAYDAQLQMVKNFNAGNAEDSTLQPLAAAVGEKPDNFWVGDANNALYHFFQIFGQPVNPNSPGTASAFNLSSYGGALYVSAGGAEEVGAPTFNGEGFFALRNRQWRNFPAAQLDGGLDVTEVVVDPKDTNHLYLALYGTGILEVRLGQESIKVERLIDADATQGILDPSTNSGELRIFDMEADTAGNIWFGLSLSSTPLGVVRPDGSVEGYSLGSAGNLLDLREIMVTTGRQVWLQRRNDGIVVADISDLNNLRTRVLSTTEGSGNLPSNRVLAFAEDRDGEIWIGTNEGLAVLFSPQNIFEPERSYDASILVIDEDGDGAGERVLGAQAIVDIAVDGSNKKWFATTGSGVFYTSETGREQLNRFTSSNSPLPTDNLIDIEVDGITGMVYFGTEEGIVAFQGRATDGVERMSDVYAYPNPVRPDYEGPILIRGLVTNAQVKITDAAGNLVFETIAEGGQAVWNGRNFDGLKVSSGVYLAYITDDLGANTEVAKILVIR